MTTHLSVSVDPATGQMSIEDKEGGALWTSAAPRFGQMTVDIGGKKQVLDLGRCEVEKTAAGLKVAFHPLATRPAAAISFMIATTADGRGLTIGVDPAADLQVDSIRLLDLMLTAAEGGYALVPCRQGLLIPADSGVAFTRRFGTSEYEGCHMNMIGLVKAPAGQKWAGQAGATALITWDDPYVSADLKAEIPGGDKAKQVLSTSFGLRKSANTLTIRFGGKGDWSTLAKMYRTIAQEKGLVVNWDQKIKENPERAKYLGASNFKLWSALNRRMDDDSKKEISCNVNWTFDEAAQVADHLKNDLKMEKVLFTIGGWTHRGYDNQHPDVLPAAPECGGDEALAKASRHIMSLGYLFCLHDNYQDMYRDAPSYNEKYLQRTADGNIARGGKWAGGKCDVICAQMALELAKRPQNLPGIKKLTDANSFFIDTTYAAGLQECYAKEHPLTRSDDMKWKIALSDYSRGVFGTFGSECGREWAIPHADFFEGLTGVSGQYYHNMEPQVALGASVVPLFEMVYHDCIAAYGKYGYSPQSAAPYVLHHILIARPLNYHNVPSHLYWKNAIAEDAPLKFSPTIDQFKQIGPRKITITYAWKVDGTTTQDWSALGHFTDARGKEILFQNDYAPTPPTSQWKPGQIIKQGPFTVSVPAKATGTYDLRIGLYSKGQGRRAVLVGPQDKEQRTLVGRVKITGDNVELLPAPEAMPEAAKSNLNLWTRGQGGWTETLHSYDRFVKNTHEVLSPLNEITARMQMTGFEFLTPDRGVRRAVFGQGDLAVTIIVNESDAPYALESAGYGRVVIPTLGFFAESSGFVAFCALEVGGVKYDAPTMFTARALDGKPLAGSGKIRVYHAFGDDRIHLGKREWKVARQAVVGD